jgi:polysaccharide deacetylase 2 family uncharacterized protein YibQ
MHARSVIRKLPEIRIDVTSLRLIEFAFCLILVLAAGLESRGAVSGVSELFDSVLPTGQFEAKASSGEPSNSVMQFVRSPGDSGSFQPQVIFPIIAHAFPDWLRERIASPNLPEAAQTPVTKIPEIAIVIDDMGNDVVQGRRAIALAAPISLSFLPYPDATTALAQDALRGGHEVLAHIPMEALGGEDPGPMALSTALDAAENLRRLAWGIARVPGLSGINNHMGSKFTADGQALAPVMEALADRRLYFFDSKTSEKSGAVEVAHLFGVASGSRDVFLDDDQNPAAIENELKVLESIARRAGVAIAIGHPHAATLDVLVAWTKSVSARGFVLVPLHEAIRAQTERTARLSLASTAH